MFGEDRKMKAAPHHYLVAYTSAFSMALGVVAAITLMLLALHDEGGLVANFGV